MNNRKELIAQSLENGGNARTKNIAEFTAGSSLRIKIKSKRNKSQWIIKLQSTV
jgi:hypothetical protein